MKRHCPDWKKRILVVCGTSMLLASFSIQAAEWSAEPSVSLKEEYSDNIHLTALPHASVGTTTLSPSLTLSHSTEISKISAGAKLDFNRYTGESGLDRTDQYYTWSSSYTTERSIWNLDAGYTKNFASQFDVTAYGAQSLVQRREVSLGPSWTWSLSENNSITFGYQYSGVAYERGSTFSDYTYQTVSVAATHNYSERDQFTLTAYDSKYKTASGDYESDTIGLSGGLSHIFSETLRGSVTIGSASVRSSFLQPTVRCLTYREVTTPSGEHILFCDIRDLVQILAPVESLDSTSSLNANLSKQFETTTISANLSRQLSPSGNGVLVQSDTANVTIAKALTETMTGSVYASAYRTSYIGNALSANGVRHFSIEPKLVWRLTDWSTLDLGYRYDKQEYDNNINSAKANAVYAQYRYVWPKISFSR